MEHSVARWLSMRRVSKQALAGGQRSQTSSRKLSEKFSKVNELLL
jgi:hypothetical protein